VVAISRYISADLTTIEGENIYSMKSKRGGCVDEGRRMAEVIYDTAPNANYLFYSALGGSLNQVAVIPFYTLRISIKTNKHKRVKAILNLAANGATVSY